MAFKTKTKTRLLIDDRQTLDAKHNNILTTFTNNKESLTELYKELLNINNKLIDLNIINNKSPMFNIEIQNKIWLYDDKKNEIKININRIENNIDETEYMLNTGKLISNYYKIINEEKKFTIKHNTIDTNIDNKNNNKNNNINTNINNNMNKVSKKNKSITDWFDNKEDLTNYSYNNLEFTENNDNDNNDNDNNDNNDNDDNDNNNDNDNDDNDNNDNDDNDDDDDNDNDDDDDDDDDDEEKE